MIYFDHAATTPLDEEVLQKMLPYFTQTFGNPDSAHAYGRRAMAGVDAARDEIAAILKVKPKEIYFTSGGSEGNTWAIRQTVKARGGKHVIVGSTEHPSVLNCAGQLTEEGVDVTYLPVDENGVVSLSALEGALRKDTSLVAVMAGNNETGVLQPVEQISALLRPRGIHFHCDCVQTAGLYDLPVGIADSISVSAHKFYGPKGVGFLYLKSGTAIRPLVNGGEQERGLRGGTTNVPGVVGMAEAFSRAQRAREGDKAHIAALRDTLEERLLKEIGNVRISSRGADRLAGISNVTFFGAQGTSLLFRLDRMGIAVSLGSACASGSIGASHVLTAMGMSEKDALSSVRFSFGRENTAAEVDQTVSALKEILPSLR